MAGHRGMVGSAICRRLASEGRVEIITRTRQELDLLDRAKVEQFLEEERPSQVYQCAARVGGILANNTYPAEFIHENLVLETNIIHAAWKAGIRNLLFLGSSCIFPRDCPQPMNESALLTGPLESTNEPYAVAKIAGIKLCESYNRQYGTDYRSVMPTNLYGPNDNFHPQNSHVIPGLMRRIHEARVAGDESVTIWGTGNAQREFMHVDDMADACIHMMNLSRATLDTQVTATSPFVNVGTGTDVSIRELAELLVRVVGFEGDLQFDASKPDGMPRKLLDVSRMDALGWRARIGLEQGLIQTYEWYCANQAVARGR